MTAEAGIVVLGNIEADKFNTSSNMVEAINPIFRESATLDRFHGLIPGWEIPRLNQGLIAFYPIWVDSLKVDQGITYI